jgi:hypothetical protein
MIGPVRASTSSKPRPETRGVVHHRQDGEHTHPVGDEVGGVLGADDALAQAGGEPGLQGIQGGGIGRAGGDQLHQRHVARRVEEVDAAEAGAGLGRHAFGQGVDGQAGGVGGKDRIRADEGSDLGVEVELPLHLLGNGLDDEVAVAKLVQIATVIGHINELGTVLGGQGCRLELLQPIDGLAGNGTGGAFLGGKVEEDDRHAGVGAVGGDLRPHHASTQHSHLANDQSAHMCLL